MLPREVARVGGGGYPGVPRLAEDTALHLPLYFSRPISRQLAYRSSLDIPSLYHAEGLLGSSAYAPAPGKMPSRRKRDLKVVKKPFKPSQKRKGMRSSFHQGGNSWKAPFQANKKAPKGKKEAQRPTFTVARALALADEVRTLHALWRANRPADTRAKTMQKLENESQSQSSVDLIEEVRALHSLWRAGPVDASANVGVGRKKVNSHLDPGLPSKMAQTEPGNAPKKSRKQKKKKKKKARKPATTPSTPSSFSAKSVDFPAEEVASTSSTRRTGALLMIKEEVVQFEMPMEPQKNAHKHVTGLSGSDHGGIELLKQTPDRERADFEMWIELQKDACKHVMEFLGTVHGGMGLENLTPEQEKAREEEGFLFFSNLFTNNSGLRSLYVGQGNGGTLDCLVCHTIGDSKSFDKVLSLVMHTTTRVKSRPEHRGYGRAVSEILGWNSNN